MVTSIMFINMGIKGESIRLNNTAVGCMVEVTVGNDKPMYCNKSNVEDNILQKYKNYWTSIEIATLIGVVKAMIDGFYADAHVKELYA